MNYKHHYDRLILKARNRSIPKNVYREIHHIIPKCIGGTDDENNLIALLAEEHLVAHLLLTKIYPTSFGLLKAAYSMTNGFNYGTRSFNKEYKWVRENYVIGQSAWMKENHYLKQMSPAEKEDFLSQKFRGENNPNFGNRWSDEQRKKASDRLKGKMVGEKNYNYGNRGEKNPIFGRKFSDSHKRKISKAISGDKNPSYGLKGSLAKEAKKYTIIHPDNTKTELFGTIATTLLEFCNDHQLNHTRIKNNINKGVIGKTYVSYKGKVDVVNCEGWEIISE